MMLAIAASWDCAPGAADPLSPSPDDQSAATTIGDLDSQGYDVEINFVSGDRTRPLSQC